jgi:hexosaminidase
MQPASAQQVVQQALPKGTSPMHLQWEWLRDVHSSDSPFDVSVARLTIANTTGQSLPPRGWGIYFNCLDGVVPAKLDGHLVLEQVDGQLFRIRPDEGFAGLAPGQSLSVDITHRTVVTQLAHTPIGFYLAFDNDPSAARQIDDVRIVLDGRAPKTSPEMLFARNQRIASVADDAFPPVFPTPGHIERHGGQVVLHAMPRIDASPTLTREAAFAKSLFAPYFGTTAFDAHTLPLRLALGSIAGYASPEAYELKIDAHSGISIKGNSAAGVWMGLQSLRALQMNGDVALPELFIRDAPRYAYRGFMLDVARNFQSKEAVFRILDLMARYKLNTFHFHLTDDEGWRIAIAGLPELTAVGGRRGHAVADGAALSPAYGSGPNVDDPHGSGHYTRADYIQIVKYAAARHIEVLPEIEMPGHARAAIMAMRSRYQRLLREGRQDAARFLPSDPDDASDYVSVQMYRDNVLNPAMPGTYALIERVVAELVDMHKAAGAPLRTIHVGADETPAGAWEASPKVRELMQQRQLASKSDVWDFFYARVNRILGQHGLRPSGWEELGLRRTAAGEGHAGNARVPNPVLASSGAQVMLWTDVPQPPDLPARLARSGYRVVLAPASRLYLDMAHDGDLREFGVHWAGHVDLDTIHDYDPGDGIEGIEATLFSETVRDVARLDHMLMPRLLAVAERAWVTKPQWASEQEAARRDALRDEAWSRFVHVVGKRVLPRLDAEHTGIAYRIPRPGLKRTDAGVLANLQLPGFVLRYTVDGREPDASSPIVSGPIVKRGRIRVAAFNREGRSGLSSQIDN